MSASVQIYNFHLPKTQLGKFHEILTACGGRYIGELKESGNDYLVSYEHNSQTNANHHTILFEAGSKGMSAQAWSNMLKHTRESFQRAS